MFPDLADILGSKKTVRNGWTYSLAKDLIESEIELHVVTTSLIFSDFESEINGIHYHLLQSKKSPLKYDKSLEVKFKAVLEDIKPNLIHIHGTEYAHSLVLMRACPNERYVISIQGLVSVYSKHYLGDIKPIDIFKNITFRDILKWDNLFQQRNKFSKMGELEIKSIKHSPNILGRTSWDHSHAKAINPKCNYYVCNRTFRHSFYESKKWNVRNINRHTLFLSQAGSPIKGLHKVIEAIILLKDDFPNIKIRVGGNNIIQNETLKLRLSRKGYGKYVKNLLDKYGLTDNVEFLGPLDEKKMIAEYLKANAFICPSSIENSPNSLGEAQILGTPVVSSYVGGVADMVVEGETGLLYRFEEIELLAQHIRIIFTDDDLATKLSKNGIVAANKRHDRDSNVKALITAYKSMVTNDKLV